MTEPSCNSSISDLLLLERICSMQSFSCVESSGVRSSGVHVQCVRLNDARSNDIRRRDMELRSVESISHMSCRLGPIASNVYDAR